MTKPTIIEKLKQRGTRSAIIGICLGIFCIAAVFLMGESRISPYALFAVILSGVLWTFVDFALFPIPRCPKCNELLKLVLKLSKEERSKVRFCPYCAASLDVEE